MIISSVIIILGKVTFLHDSRLTAVWGGGAGLGGVERLSKKEKKRKKELMGMDNSVVID